MLLNPKIHPEWKGSIYDWRQFLKKELLIKRNWKSDWSGEKLLTCEMHEGIVTRAMVPKSIKWHYLIYDERNSFLLLPSEHRPNPPSKSWCVGRAYELYGRDVIRDWFYGLPWKSIPFRLP